MANYIWKWVRIQLSVAKFAAIANTYKSTVFPNNMERSNDHASRIELIHTLTMWQPYLSIPAPLSTAGILISTPNVKKNRVEVCIE